MNTVVVLSRLVLVVVFAAAGVGKLLDLQGSRQAVRDFGVPDGLADAAGLLLPLAELATALALLFVPTAQWGGLAALLLLLAFMAGIANALRNGVAPDCHCFGQIHSAPAGRETLIRNGVLAVLAAIVTVQGPGPAIPTWVGDQSAATLVAIGLGLVAAGLLVVYLPLRREVHELRTDINQARRMAASAPPGLPVGTPAPTFSLKNMEGETVTLDELHRTTPALLVFASPWCGGCSEVFPSIRRWQQTLRDRLQIAVVTAGTVEDNAPLREEYGLKTVLLQKDSEMIEAYRIRGTPTAMLVTPEGRIGAAPAESVFGIEPLVRLVLRGDGAQAAPLAVPEGSLV